MIHIYQKTMMKTLLKSKKSSNNIKYYKIKSSQKNNIMNMKKISISKSDCFQIFLISKILLYNNMMENFFNTMKS